MHKRPIRSWLRARKARRTHLPDIYAQAQALHDARQEQRQRIRRSLDDLRQEAAAERYGRHALVEPAGDNAGSAHPTTKPA